MDDYDGEGDMDVGYEVDPMGAFQGNENDYTYHDLLSRAFYKIRQANPEMGDRKRYTMIPPQILREGTKKTIFSNLTEICKRMHRNQEHVVQFLFTELGTSGSVDGSQRLVIKGRYMPKHIENVLRHYIVEYVTCKICKSPNTVLVKENRLNFVHVRRRARPAPRARCCAHPPRATTVRKLQLDALGRRNQERFLGADRPPQALDAPLPSWRSKMTNGRVGGREC